MTWDYYKPRAVIRDANVKVLELIEAGVRQHEIRYRVRLLCCGDEREMTHQLICERGRKKPKRCQACRYRDTARSPEAKQNMRDAQARSRDLTRPERPKLDMAPPPPIALNLPRGWMPR